MSSPGAETAETAMIDSGSGDALPADDSLEEQQTESDNNDGGQREGVLEVPTPTPDGTKVAANENDQYGFSHVSAVTFADSAGRGTAATNNTGTTGTTAGRKIHREDLRQIFQASVNTGTVSMDQLLRIKKMHTKISDGVNWDFNYSCLLMVASVVAGLGLALDSSTTVISSMLLSPIMGPVIGMSYGLIIWDLPLIRRSMRNELASILICVIFGVVLGLCTKWTHMAHSWPTNEMISRGTRTTFLAGIPIAFFSGLGVALSVLDDQTSSLVGVAISASLLPPAVNCGMLLIVSLMDDDNAWYKINFEYQSEEELAEEAVVNFPQMALMSLLLTVANVIMVAVGATLMMRLKEVLPVNKKVFWEDLKIARRLYQGRAVDSVTGEALNFDECAKIALELEQSGEHRDTTTVSKHSTQSEHIGERTHLS